MEEKMLDPNKWSEADWAHNDFLVTLSKLYGKEDVDYMFYDNWWVCANSLFSAIQDKYLKQYE